MGRICVFLCFGYYLLKPYQSVYLTTISLILSNHLVNVEVLCLNFTHSNSTSIESVYLFSVLLFLVQVRGHWLLESVGSGGCTPISITLCFLVSFIIGRTKWANVTATNAAYGWRQITCRDIWCYFDASFSVYSPVEGTLFRHLHFKSITAISEYCWKHWLWSRKSCNIKRIWEWVDMHLYSFQVIYHCGWNFCLL